MTKRNLIPAWWQGVRDGWEQPHELTSGITWDDDQDRNEAYDRGVNLGQFVRAPRNHQR